LHAKLNDCYKKGTSPNLDSEITLLNDAPLNTFSQALGDNQEESKGGTTTLGAIVTEQAKGNELSSAHDCDDETLDLR
jgi:hypothetical protein